MADTSNIQSAASKSIRPFRSSEDYLYAMKEDLAEWLNTLYDLDVQVENFMDALETGYDLCQHANNVNRIAMEFQQSNPETASHMRIPQKEVVFQAKNVVPGSFIARDNISNFIQWCRQELGIPDVVMFETNDLVLKKNEKNVVLCLLEVARKGSKFGMLAPMLIQMEEEIEEEMRDQVAGGELKKERVIQDLGPKSPVYLSKMQRIALCDLKNLDELVREILGHCTCPSQFPMVKVSEGKYQVGDSNALIFVRVLRSHVMVRVGGGWDTLEHYLDKHDPCRCTSISHRLTQSRGLGFSPQKTSGLASPQANSPTTQRRAEATGLHPKVPEPHHLGEKRLLAGGDPTHPKGNRPGPPTKRSGTATPPRQGSLAPPSGKCSGSGQRGASPLRGYTSQAHQDTGDSHLSVRNPRARRLSGDSDSSSSSSRHSASLGRKRNEDTSLALRKEAGRRISEGPASQLHASPKRPPASRSQSRDRLSLSKTVTVPRKVESEERGRPRVTSRPSKPGSQSPRPRARSQGRPAGEPVLLISRAKDGQHSILCSARADEPKENAGGSGRTTPRTKSPARGHLTPVGSRSPALTKRRGSLPATKLANPSIRMPPPGPGRQRQPCLTGPCGTVKQPHLRESGPSRQPNDTFGQELDVTAQAFRTPLRLDPSQEQQLYRRLEEEFLANSQIMGLEMDEELEPGIQACNGARLLPTNPDQGTADSAYCSSSSSSSSLNVFSKYSLQPEESKRKAAHQMAGGSELVDFHNGSAEGSELWDSSSSRERRSRWRKPILSSSSDESNCYLGLNDVQELTEPLVDSLWAAGEQAPSHTECGPSLQDGSETLGSSPAVPVLEEVVLCPQSSLRRPDHVPSIYKLKLRPPIKPRADTQPDKTPSKIPTPFSYKASGGQKAPTESASSKDSPARGPSERRGWAAFHNIFSSSFGDCPGGPVESGVADEGTWA